MLSVTLTDWQQLTVHLDFGKLSVRSTVFYLFLIFMPNGIITGDIYTCIVLHQKVAINNLLKCERIHDQCTVV